MSFIIVIISCVVPMLLALAAPRLMIRFFLYTGALPFGMIFDGEVFTPFGRFNVLSLRVLGVLLGCGFVLLIHFKEILPYWRKWILWAFFLTWCAASIFWGENWAYGLRMFSKVCAPLFFAGAVIVMKPKESDYRMVENAIFWNLMILAAIAVGCKALGIVGVKGALTVPSHGPAVFAAFLMIPICLATAKIVCGQHRLKWSFAWLVAVACALAAYGRTPLAAEAIGILAIIFSCLPLILRIPYLLTFSFLPLIMFLNVDYLKHRMFYKNADVTLVRLFSEPGYVLSHLDTSGRSQLWLTLLNKFYRPDPVFGSGLGATESYLHGVVSASSARAVHSEYIRLICETGWVGLVLFLLAGTVTILTVFFSIARLPKKYKPVGLAALALSLSYAIFSASDNAINYVNVQTIYLCFYVALSFTLLARVEAPEVAAGEGQLQLERYP
jgi:hypothetical protein